MKRILQFALLLLAAPLAVAQTATINGGSALQTMDGFGAQTWLYADSLTGSNANLFFSTTSGIGLSYVRTANTWDGGIPDLTTLQSAVALGAQVELGLQSPPCSLKHSYVDLSESCTQSGDGGIQPTAFTDGTAGSSGTCFANGLSLDGSTGAFHQYAAYIVALINTYQGSPNSIPITYLDVQNEATNPTSSLGGCAWSNGSQFQDFVKNYLGPQLSAAGLTPKVMLGSLCCWFGTDLVSACLNDSSCSPYVTIASGHGYPYPYSASAPPSSTAGKHIWMSETSDSGSYDASMTSALVMAQNEHQFLTTSGVSSYQWWELAWPSSANFGLTDSSFNTTKRFWATGNWSKFVRPGWVAISATANPQSNVYVTAFKNPANSQFAIVAINTNGSGTSQPFSLSGLTASSVTPYITDSSNNLASQSPIGVSGSSFSATLTANSVTTFVGTGTSSPLWSGVLTSARADSNWPNVGATIPTGTIPACATQPASNTPAAITTAFNADAGGGSYCQINIPAGTYNVSGTIKFSYAGKANVILNGAGPNQTFFVWTGGGNSNCNGLNVTEICTFNGDTNGFSGNESFWANSSAVTGGYSQGSTTLNLSSFSTLKVGMLLGLAQQDPSSDNGNAYFCATTGSNGTCSWQGSSSAPRPGGVNNSEAQIVVVTGCGTSTYGATCTSGTVTIDSPIKAPNWTSGQNPTAWWDNTLPISNVGIQNLSFDVSGITAGIFDECHMCTNVWYQNIRQVNGTVQGQSSTNHFIFWNGHHITVQNTYMYGSNPNAEGYGVDFDASTSDSLAQNNITQHVETGYITETGVGNVFGYNYAVDNYFGSNWQQCDQYNHDAGDYYNLFEGNVGICAVEDSIHGSHLWQTYFREYLSGYDPATVPNGAYTDGNIMSIQMGAYSRYANVVANVLGNTSLSKPTSTYQNVGVGGSPSPCSTGGEYPLEVVYSLNFSDGGNQQPFGPCIGEPFYIINDTLAGSTMMRWGNYDVVHGSVQENSGETASGAPTYPGLASPSTSFPASFYLSSQPSWWNTTISPWPGIGPDVTGGSIPGVSGHAYLNMAANCYLNVMGGSTSGSSGALTFNPSSCYAGGGTPTAAAPSFSPVSPYSGVATTVTLSSTTPSPTITYCQDTTNTCTPATTGTSVSFSSNGYIRAFTTAAGYLQSGTSSWQGTISTSTLAAPTFSPVGSVDSVTAPYFLPASFPLAVTPAIPAGTGCYRLDGTAPTAPTAGTCGSGSTTYTSGAISVAANQTLKMLATEVGSTNSSVTASTYNQRNLILDSSCNFNGGNSSVSSGSCTLSPNPSSGDAITCGGVMGSNIPSMTFGDNISPGSYTVANPLYYGSATYAASQRVYRSGLPGGTTTVTMTLSSPSSYTGFACEAYKSSTGSCSLALDTTFTQSSPYPNATTGSTANPSIASDTPSNANELIYGGLVTYQNVPTAGTGFTLVDTLPGGPNLWPEYQIQAAATATTLPYVLAADQWQLQPTGFYCASSGLPPPTSVNATINGATIQ